ATCTTARSGSWGRRSGRLARSQARRWARRTRSTCGRGHVTRLRRSLLQARLVIGSEASSSVSVYLGSPIWW
ncbi:hypothetical protein T484DRAFT_1906438, partial [Baffinella frigidus]